jgi:hypothetical protein
MNFKMSKNSEIKFQVYMLTFYVHTQIFVGKKLCGMYKKDKKKVPYVVVLEHQKLSFLHEI